MARVVRQMVVECRCFDISVCEASCRSPERPLQRPADGTRSCSVACRPACKCSSIPVIVPLPAGSVHDWLETHSTSPPPGQPFRPQVACSVRPMKSRSADTTLSGASSAIKCPQFSNSCSSKGRCRRRPPCALRLHGPAAVPSAWRRTGRWSRHHGRRHRCHGRCQRTSEMFGRAPCGSRLAVRLEGRRGTSSRSGMLVRMPQMPAHAAAVRRATARSASRRRLR